MTVRRLHDTGRSGSWFLIVLLPIVGTIILIVFLAGGSLPDGPLTTGGQTRPVARPSRRGGRYAA